MVWSHYLQEINTTNTNDDYASDEEEHLPSRHKAMPYDDWVTWYSNDLLNMWMGMRAYKEDSGNTTFILDHAEYDDFCHFCYEFSCKLPSMFPS